VTLASTAIVNGVGGVGLMVIQVAKLAGADVIAVGDTEAKLALAKEYGATETVRVADAKEYDSLPERIQKLTAGAGADYFFELVGTAASMSAGFRSLGKRGTFVTIGYSGDLLTINPVDLLIKEQRLVTNVAATRQDLDDAVRLAGAGKLRAAIQSRIPLDQLQDALRGLRERRVLGRNVVTFA
jgi:alcohol dehydrogenase, propanol-preferring